MLKTPPKAYENQIKCKNEEKAIKSLLFLAISVNSFFRFVFEWVLQKVICWQIEARFTKSILKRQFRIISVNYSYMKRS